MIALGHKDTNHSGHEEVEHNAPAAVVSTNSAHFPLHNNNWDHYPVEHAAQNAQSKYEHLLPMRTLGNALAGASVPIHFQLSF